MAMKLKFLVAVYHVAGPFVWRIKHAINFMDLEGKFNIYVSGRSPRQR